MPSLKPGPIVMLHKLQTLMHGIYFRCQILMLAKYSLHAGKSTDTGTWNDYNIISCMYNIVILYHHID